MQYECAQIESDINNIKKQIVNVRNEYQKISTRLDGKYSEMEKLTNSDDKFTVVRDGQKQEFVIREKHIKGGLTRPAEPVEGSQEERGRLSENVEK